MFRFLFMALCLSGVAASGCAVAAPPSYPTGEWITANQQAVVRVAPCGNDICGTLIGIVFAHPTDPMPVDWRGQPQCGDVLFRVSPETEDDGSVTWHGQVTDVRDGTVYHASVSFDEQNQLHLRGYLALPLLGETQIWQPYNGHILTGCRVPS